MLQYINYVTIKLLSQITGKKRRENLLHLCRSKGLVKGTLPADALHFAAFNLGNPRIDPLANFFGGFEELGPLVLKDNLLHLGDKPAHFRVAGSDQLPVEFLPDRLVQEPVDLIVELTDH